MDVLHMNDSMTAKLLSSKLTTYSISGRARNVEFTIPDISREAIIFRKQNGKEQTARRGEIDYVSSNWEAYKSGDVSRHELGKKSFNTSYLFGLFHFIEEELK